ncbi:MAG: helix-turn-helix domain-containing protein [Clostridia bacterium]|nr:helix-turn-helix domain-containing protein [Clostridia bacterium]
MPIQYKIDILKELREKGYTQFRIRQEKLIGQSYLQQIRKGEIVSKNCLETLCELLECQPGDLLEYVSDKKQNK